MVERGIAGVAPPTTDIIYDYSVSALRLEIMMLRGKNEALERKQAQQPDPTQPGPLDKRVVDLLRNGGSWPSTRIIKELGNDHAKTINNTLEQLYSLELIKRDWGGGWSWI